MRARNRALAATVALVGIACAWLVTGPLSANSAGTASAPSISNAGPVVTALEEAGMLRRDPDGNVHVDVDSVDALLEQIDTGPAQSSPGYDEEAFGQRWADTDRNGCDQRNDVLARDLVDETFKPGTQGCVVLTGTLVDPYTGATISFQRGTDTSTAVQIDHLIPRAYAFRHGASSWSSAQRETFANDLDNLEAVDGLTNASKSDRGPAEWLPPADSYRCLYLTRFVFVAHKYEISLSDSDRAAITGLLPSCR